MFVLVCVVPEVDPNAEVCHWLEVEQAWREVYSQTFTLPAGVIETNHSRNNERVSPPIIHLILCVMSVVVQSVKEAVKEALLAYLSSRGTPFTLHSLGHSEEVMGAVCEGVRGEIGEERRPEVERELRALVKKLPDMGLVVPVQDPSSSMYEVSCVCVC